MQVHCPDSFFDNISQWLWWQLYIYMRIKWILYIFLLIMRDKYMAWEWQCTVHQHEQESLYTSSNRNSNVMRSEVQRTLTWRTWPDLTWVTCNVTPAEFSASSLRSWRRQPTAHFSRKLSWISWPVSSNRYQAALRDKCGYMGTEEKIA